MGQVRQRIVIVDDDPLGTKVVRFLLDDEGYDTVSVTRGSQVLAQVIGRETDLVILDVNLPDIDGFTVYTDLRAQRYTGPILFLTSRSAMADRLTGLRLGADDYLTKPYEPLEFVARVRAIIRRSKRADAQALGTVVQVDDAELSLGELTYASKVVPPTLLTPTEMRLLECLMRNRQIVISRETLIERVWGFDFLGDTNRVDVYIRRVRRKIEVDPTMPEYLHTVRGVGYVFRVAPGCTEQRSPGVDGSAPARSCDPWTMRRQAAPSDAAGVLPGDGAGQSVAASQ